jgi:hypothetical protein
MDDHTLTVVLQWLRSAATPTVFAISYKESSATSGCIFKSSASGWPIPPAAPNSATLRAPAFASTTTDDRLLLDILLADIGDTTNCAVGLVLRSPSKLRDAMLCGRARELGLAADSLQLGAPVNVVPAKACIVSEVNEGYCLNLQSLSRRLCPSKPNPLRYNPKQSENPPALLSVATKMNCKSFLGINTHAAGNVLEV